MTPPGVELTFYVATLCDHHYLCVAAATIGISLTLLVLLVIKGTLCVLYYVLFSCGRGFVGKDWLRKLVSVVLKLWMTLLN